MSTSTMTGAQPSSFEHRREGLASKLVQSRLFPWLLVALGVGALVLIDIPVCGFKALTGLPCPGCGMTRALSSLLVGDVSSAFYFHPLVFVLLAVVGVVAVMHLVLRRDIRPTWAVSVLVVFGLLSLALWVFRLTGGLGGHPDLEGPLF